jgi:hypothetical protein
MNRDDEDLVRLRPYATLLGQEVDVARLVGSVMARVRPGDSVLVWLERWMRTLVIAFAAASLVLATVFYRAERSEVPDFGTITENQIVAESSYSVH